MGARLTELSGYGRCEAQAAANWSRCGQTAATRVVGLCAERITALSKHAQGGCHLRRSRPGRGVYAWASPHAPGGFQPTILFRSTQQHVARPAPGGAPHAVLEFRVQGFRGRQGPQSPQWPGPLPCAPRAQSGPCATLRNEKCTSAKECKERRFRQGGSQLLLVGCTSVCMPCRAANRFRLSDVAVVYPTHHQSHGVA